MGVETLQTPIVDEEELARLLHEARRLVDTQQAEESDHNVSAEPGAMQADRAPEAAQISEQDDGSIHHDRYGSVDNVDELRKKCPFFGGMPPDMAKNMLGVIIKTQAMQAAEPQHTMPLAAMQSTARLPVPTRPALPRPLPRPTRRPAAMAVVAVETPELSSAVHHTEATMAAMTAITQQEFVESSTPNIERAVQMSVAAEADTKPALVDKKRTTKAAVVRGRPQAKKAAPISSTPKPIVAKSSVRPPVIPLVAKVEQLIINQRQLDPLLPTASERPRQAAAATSKTERIVVSSEREATRAEELFDVSAPPPLSFVSNTFERSAAEVPDDGGQTVTNEQPEPADVAASRAVDQFERLLAESVPDVYRDLFVATPAEVSNNDSPEDEAQNTAEFVSELQALPQVMLDRELGVVGGNEVVKLMPILEVESAVMEVTAEISRSLEMLDAVGVEAARPAITSIVEAVAHMNTLLEAEPGNLEMVEITAAEGELMAACRSLFKYLGVKVSPDEIQAFARHLLVMDKLQTFQHSALAADLFDDGMHERKYYGMFHIWRSWLQLVQTKLSPSEMLGRYAARNSIAA